MKSIAASLLFAFVLILPPFTPLVRGQSAKFTVLYKFSPLDGNGLNTDGSYPNRGLVQGRDGSLYDTAKYAGPYGKGTAFKVTPGGTFTVLQRFGNNNGAFPQAGLLLASDGNFYGTTSQGGTYNKGTAFKLTASGQRTTLHNFTGQPTQDSAHPGICLVEGKDGNFYGLTGGDTGYLGSVYRMTPAGVVTILHTFTSSVSNAQPIYSPIIVGSDGNLYGVIFGDVGNNQGYIYRVTTDGTFDMLYQYENEVIVGALAEGAPGVFYGTFYSSTKTGIFRLTSDGQYTVVPLSNASGPVGGISFGGALLLASDGNLYGVGAPTSGNTRQSSIYSVKPDGSNFTVLYQGFTGADGENPESPLTQGRNGTFYGATPFDSINGTSTIFNLAVPPTITSAAAAMGVVGQPFSYQISGSLVPTHFGALGLPAGLKVDAKTGLITGTPGKTLTKTLTLQATNTGGTGTGMLKLSISN